ncbi:MAG: MFS transporter [Myxococcota bacterium]|nr:MFS transporter [Myxococcota bacterium]
MTRARPDLARFVALFSLIVAAETIFSLPYHVARFFRPTLLLALDLDNTQLGLVQSAYGVVAMLAYFPGGPLADLFPVRKLLTASLVCTAAGGIYFAQLPSFDGLWLLFAFWGLTTILLFWAALIRATREWGDPERQGQAYGLLDAGRGLLAALMASVAVGLFALFFPENSESLTESARQDAIRGVILFYTGITFLAALLTWFFVAEPAEASPPPNQPRVSGADIRKIFRMPAVWLQALIVVCAYVGYKGIDYYSLFAVDVYGFSELEAARLSAATAWVRPFAALGAGLLGDRIRHSRAIGLCFVLLALAYVLPLVVDFGSPGLPLFLINVAVSSAAAFGLRGIYFALLEEGAIPAVATGTAVGVVSVLGYSPDVFFGVLSGWIIDEYPGWVGYQIFSIVMMGFALLGLAGSLLFSRGVPRWRQAAADSGS